MRKAICPITKQPLDCKSCEVVKDDCCPYFEFDECIEHTLQFIRKLVEKEMNGENAESRS